MAAGAGLDYKGDVPRYKQLPHAVEIGRLPIAVDDAEILDAWLVPFDATQAK